MRPIRTCLLLASVAAAARAQTNPPAWTLAERLRLDANTEDFSALQLTRQGNAPFYIGPHRELVIPFNQDGEIRIYDSTGKRVASVGRRGAGPGEFRNFFRLGWVRDTMWVYDAIQRRMSFYDPQWKLLRTHVTADGLRQQVDANDPNPRVISDFAPSAIVADGNTLGQIIQVTGRTPGGWLDMKYFVASVAPDNSVRQLTELPAAAVSPRVWMNVPTEAKHAFSMVPFGNDAVYAVSPMGDRYAVVTTNRATKTIGVSMHAANGTLRYTKSVPFTPIAIPANVADSAATAATRSLRQAPEVVAEMRKKVREAMPASYPPVTGVVLARDGTTWLRMYAADPSRVSFTVLDPRGELAGRVTLKKGADVVDADGQTAWGVDVDEDGLGSVVVWKVTR